MYPFAISFSSAYHFYYMTSLLRSSSPAWVVNVVCYIAST